MIIYPAIDIKDGRCVRLYKGDFDAVTVFNESPASQADLFRASGFEWLHVVDLDGAVSARPVNVDPVQDIIRQGGLKVQLGGGIRNMETIDFWIEQGVQRVILGTAAVRYPELVKVACKQHPGKIAVGIDARGGMVATEGWVQNSRIEAKDFARIFEDSGVSAIIYTDIERDGTLEGSNLDETSEIAEAVSIPVILSGGVSSLEELKQLKKPPYNRISGVIIGKALYQGAIDFKAAADFARA